MTAAAAIYGWKSAPALGRRRRAIGGDRALSRCRGEHLGSREAKKRARSVPSLLLPRNNTAFSIFRRIMVEKSQHGRT